MGEELSPFGEGRGARGGIFVAFGQVLALGGGEGDLGGIAVNAPPHEGEHDAGGADDEEHPAPAQAEHEERKQRDGDEVAEGRGGLQKAGGEAALANAEPIAHHAGSAGEERSFADAEREARGDEDAEAC